MKTCAFFRIISPLLIVAASAVPATSQVRLAWTARFRGSDRQNNIPYGLRVSPDGNIVVSGTAGYTNGSHFTELITLKYSADGRLLWQVPYRSDPTSFTFPPRMAMDAAGHIYVAALVNRTVSTYIPMLTVVKYDTNGHLLWISHFGDTLAAQPSDVEVDADGHLHIHATLGSGISSAYLTMKLDPAGQLAWAREYAGPVRQDQSGNLTLDTQGNIYVTGRSPAANHINDIATLKYTPDGTRLWLRRFASTNPAASDAGRDLALDGNNNLYVAGGGTLGFVTLKYTVDGESLWVTNRPNILGEGAADFIAVDREGNAFVAGTTASHEGPYWLLLKDNPDGRLLWTHESRYSPGSRDFVGGLVLDESGAAYVTGSSSTNEYGTSVLVTAKHSSDGTELWRVIHPWTVHPNGTGHAIALDRDGNVYVAAAARDVPLNDDILVAKYSQARPAAELLSAAFNPAGKFAFTLFAEAGHSYTVEASSDLDSWTPVTNLFNATGILSFTDPSARGNSPRFYRAVR